MGSVGAWIGLVGAILGLTRLRIVFVGAGNGLELARFFQARYLAGSATQAMPSHCPYHGKPSNTKHLAKLQPSQEYPI